MHGEQIEQFWFLIPKIIDFFKSNSEDSFQVQNIMKLLHFYLLIDVFMRIIKVL